MTIKPQINHKTSITCANMGQATSNPSCDERLIRALFLKFNAIWGHKWSSVMPDQESFAICLGEWMEGLQGIRPESMKDAIDHCRNCLDWPPSIAEFRKLCFQVAGFPSVKEIMDQGIRRNFENPVVKIIFDHLSAAFRSDSEDSLRKKISDCLNDINIKMEIDQLLLEKHSHGRDRNQKEMVNVIK